MQRDSLLFHIYSNDSHNTVGWLGPDGGLEKSQLQYRERRHADACPHVVRSGRGIY